MAEDATSSADRDVVSHVADIRSVLRSDRPPIELERYRRTYMRTRTAVGASLPLAAFALIGRFENAAITVGGIGTLGILVLIHRMTRRRSSLLEMVSFDTVMYLAMACFVDSPEIPLFIAMVQTFMVFHFVRTAVAVVVALSYLALGWIATAVTLYVDSQIRRPPDALFLATVIVGVAAIPVISTQIQAAAEMHRHRQREEQLAADKDRLLADKDRFVASVSHELRTPLTAVLGLAHTLSDPNADLTRQERDEFTNLIVEQSEEVAAIVDDLLVAARAGSGHLNLVVGEVDLIDELSSVVDEDLPVDLGETTSLLAVGDPIRVRQILRNLVSNASRYGGEQKRIRLSRRGVMGIVQIQDNGEAIPASQIETIFTAYGRAHDRPGRTDSVGLGLTVSRQLARMMGGDVNYSHDGVWAAFELSLPLSVTDTTQAICASPAAAMAAHGVDTQ